MSLQHRIMIVLRGSPAPLSAPAIASILGMQAQRISSPLSRLHVYGQIERVGQEKDRACRWRGLYRAKEPAHA